MKINVIEIQASWTSCPYEFQVWVSKDVDLFNNIDYILKTLREWFGEVEYYWENCFLCSLKK